MLSKCSTYVNQSMFFYGLMFLILSSILLSEIKKIKLAKDMSLQVSYTNARNLAIALISISAFMVGYSILATFFLKKKK